MWKPLFVVTTVITLGAGVGIGQILIPTTYKLTPENIDEAVELIRNHLGERAWSDSAVITPKQEICRMLDRVYQPDEQRDSVVQMLLAAYDPPTNGGPLTKQDSTFIKEVFLKNYRSSRSLEQGRLSYQLDGTMSTDLRIGAFKIAEPVLNVPFYLYATPDVQLDAELVMVDKAKRLLISTGGPLSMTAKGYFYSFLRQARFPNEGGFSFRTLGLLSVKFMNLKDTTDMTAVRNGNLLVGAGFNVECEITGDGKGYATIELQGVHSKSFGESFLKIYGEKARSNFFGYSATGFLQIAGFIDIKAQYIQALHSHIAGLDNGIWTVSFGLSGRLKGS